HAQAFAQPWDGPAIAALLAGDGVFALSCPSGFVLARTAGGEAEILTIAVIPASRGRGAGRALMLAAAAHAAQTGAQAMFLEVGTANSPALALYDRLGFARVGLRKQYYETGSPMGTDAVVLKAALPLAGNLA